MLVIGDGKRNKKQTEMPVWLKVKQSNRAEYTSDVKEEYVKTEILHKQVSVSRKLKKDVCFIKQDSASGPG